MSSCYPLRVYEQRSFPEGFSGRVFVWDIDKTYLDTHFSSLKGMARIPVEFAVDKRAIAGMPEVLRGLRRGPGQRFAAAPIYFVSASPPQMRPVIERKMLLDGVEHDGVVFKDWLGTLRGLRPGRLREQVGFKLCALLTARLNRPASREVLFGDDAESDAQAFAIYRRLLTGELSRGEAEQLMQQAGVRRDDRRCVHELLDRLPAGAGHVEQAFIHQVRGNDAEHPAELGSWLLPVRSGFQLALACWAREYVDSTAVRQAREACAARLPSFDAEQQLHEAVARGLLSAEAAQRLPEALAVD